MDIFVPFHQHLLVKAHVKNPPKDAEILNNWFINLVKTVNMNVVAGPTSVYVNDPGNEGLTGTVTLATSHASVHIWDNLELPLIQFDIYSCKPFDLEQPMQCLEDWGLVDAEWMIIDRNSKLFVSAYGTWNSNLTQDFQENQDTF